MEYLILGPGSMGIYSLLGYLKKHESELTNIKEISGSSAGAILGVCLALKIPLDDVLDKILTINLVKITKFKLRCFLSKYGLIDMKPVREALVDLYGCDPTFSELYKKIYISAYCLNRGRTEYFSVDTHPNMKVIDAVCMSISIPFIASSITYEDMIYVDGCTKERIPVTPFIGKRKDKIMCVMLKRRSRHFEKIEDFKGFMRAMLSTILHMSDVDTKDFGSCVEIDTQDYDLYSFGMSYDDKLRLFMLGVES